jgi:hypothetical protein
VLFFAPDGSFLGKHRKIMPTGTERLVWGFGDGSTMPLFETPLGKIGAVIYWFKGQKVSAAVRDQRDSGQLLKANRQRAKVRNRRSRT